MLLKVKVLRLKHKKDPISEDIKVCNMMALLEDIFEYIKASTSYEIKPYVLLFTIFDTETALFGSFKELSIDGQEKVVEQFKEMVLQK